MYWKLPVGLTVSLVVICGFLFLRADAHEQTWINNPNIRVTQIKETIGNDTLPSTYWGENRDCTNREFPIKGEYSIFGVKVRSEERIVACGNDMPIGTVAGKLLFRGGSVAGNYKLRTNSESIVAGNNVSNYIVGSSGNFNGVGVGFAHDLRFITSYLSDGTAAHTLLSDQDIRNLNNALGQRLTMMPQTVAYSSNGEWLFFDSDGYGQVRLNMQNGSTISLGHPNQYFGGGSSTFFTAISNDGRYAVFYSPNNFLVYDLSTCKDKTSGSNRHLKSCISRNIEPERVKYDKFGGYIRNIRFLSNNEITYITSKNINGQTVHKTFRVALGDLPQYSFEYLGLGDSFASGEGAYSYKAFTNSRENKCHTSLVSYPLLVGKELNKSKFNTVACSGAVSDDIYISDISKADGYKGQAEDGFIQKERDVRNIIEQFLPGKIIQNTFLNELNPEAISVSIGGNDVGFADKITKCIIGVTDIDTTCFNTFEERVEVADEMKRIVPELAKTYEKLKENNRRVYVIGYPKVVKPNGNCAQNVKFNNSELDFADKLTELINDAVETAAKRAGVFYVNVENVLDGYRLCERSSDEVLVHGLTLRSDKKDIAAESFHPKARAHELQKDKIIELTAGLSALMPVPQPTAKFPYPGTDDKYWQIEKANRPILNIKHTTILVSPQVVNAGLSLDIPFSTSAFKPTSLIAVELHSDPVKLGSFLTDANGNLKADIELPGSIKPGYHSIHVYGEDITGQKIDLYDYAFIGLDENDFDGDGVPNENDGCVVVPSSEKDTDKDGTDDNCDDKNDPIPAPDNSLPTPVPVVVPNPISPEEPKVIGNNETVAGNETLVENTSPETETVIQTTQLAGAPDTPRRAITASLVPQTLIGEEDSTDVLGEQTVEKISSDTKFLNRTADTENPKVPDEKDLSKENLGLVVVALICVILPAIVIYKRYSRS